MLEYFDAFLIGLTATPSRQTMGFFNQNLVMEYNHQQAVVDGVNVPYNVYRIETKITEEGSTIEAGISVDRRDRRTRKVRWEELDEELPYTAGQLDRDVVAEDQIRTVIQTFRDKVATEIFPGRQHVPKTIIFAKDDSHADDIVNIVREEFGKGNDFCQKITYRTTGAKPEDLITQFRNSFNPRIVVTVDMIATGTDIKPVEIVFFMRNVRSRNFFEQMKGRGVRTISQTEFNSVTPDATDKDRFVIVDAVGVTESELGESYSLDRKPSVSFGRLLDLVAMGDREPDTLSSLASRLARLDRRLSPQDRQAVESVADGATIKDLVSKLVTATDPDEALKAAQQATGQDEPAGRGHRQSGAGTAGSGGPALRRQPGTAAAAHRNPPRLRADHRHRIPGHAAAGGVLRRRGRRAHPLLPGVHRGAPRRNHRPAGAVPAALPPAPQLRRHPRPGRRAAKPAPLLDSAPAVGRLPAA